MTTKKILMRNPNNQMMVEFIHMNKRWYHSEFDAWDQQGKIIKMCADSDNLEGYLNNLIDAGYKFVVIE